MFKEGDVVKLKKEKSFGSIFIKYGKSYIVEDVSSFNNKFISLYNIEYFFSADDFIIDEIFYRKEKILKIKERINGL
jgi:hypothetical protein